MSGETSSVDTEPGIGTIVRDAFGRLWQRCPQLHDDERTYWLEYPNLGGSPESWVKVSGNWGPVKIVEYRCAVCGWVDSWADPVGRDLRAEVHQKRHDDLGSPAAVVGGEQHGS